MSGLDEPGTTLDEPAKQRSMSSRFGDLGDRLARTFAPVDPIGEDSPIQRTNGATELPAVRESVPRRRELVVRRFPIARRGYDHHAVDQYVAELERELAELRAGSPSVTAEIERIGEHTAEILSLAHEKAQETTRGAQAEADRCLANAASNAIAITEEAKRQLAEVDSDTDAVWRERARLIDDVRSVATALFSLADEAGERFAAEPERGEPGTEEFLADEPPPPEFAPEASD